jgi:hypothetical protein
MTMTDSSHPGSDASGSLLKRQPFFRPWQGLLALLIGLIAFLVLMPDGVADRAQTVAGWLVMGLVATLAVVTIAKGLERLLDCESD